MAAEGKHITVLVSNDLQHDQRVAKVCSTLMEMGFRITLVGRLLPDSTSFERPYEIRRFRLLFRSGALFYASLNVRLFLYLLFKRTDIILANDLDTLLPAFLIARVKGKALVYDSHEYFTEAEGLTNRPVPKKVWLAIEGFIFPKLRHVITVNETIANIYRSLYHVPVQVVRNVPMLRDERVSASRNELGLPVDKRIILLQGAYIDPDRGGMELAQSMEFLEGALLLIIGSGRDLENIKRVVEERKLHDRVKFIAKLPFVELQRYTAVADVGVSLDKPLHLNYAYSLPNKLFDYIHAGLPVLVSDLPELRRIVDAYKIGAVVTSVEPHEIATDLQSMFDSGELELWRKNAFKAAQELNWQQEQEVIRKVYGPLR
jgi:glycosyltransferase involved in cell wall biosynthesis